jgi:hypothetical protein
MVGLRVPMRLDRGVDRIGASERRVSGNSAGRDSSAKRCNERREMFCIAPPSHVLRKAVAELHAFASVSFVAAQRSVVAIAEATNVMTNALWSSRRTGRFHWSRVSNVNRRALL